MNTLSFRKLTQILAIGAVILGALFSRFWNLSSIPTSLAHDEMIYAINAQSVALSGTDMTGTWNPWSLTPMHPSFAELPTIFMAPFVFLPVDPVVAAKLPFVLMSLVLPVILAGISYELFRDKKTSLATGFVSLFNPWLWQFGRMGFDSYWSLFFYCLGSYLFLRLPRLHKLWAILPFFIGFYQYQGHKLAFLPWVGIFVAYLIIPSLQKNSIARYKIRIDWEKVIAPLGVLIAALLLLAFYVFVQLPQQASSERIGTMLLPNSSEIVQQVNDERRLSLNTPITGLFINKYTVWGETLLERYAETYNPKHLFLRSQYSGFNVWTHGVFYVFDAALIFIGMLTVWKQGRRLLFSLFIFGLVTTVISAIVGNGNSFVFRPSLNLPFLLLFAGVGAGCLWKVLPRLVLIPLFGLYVVGILYFAFTYFVRYPVYAAESNYFSDKVLAEYVRRLDPEKEILIYTPEPHFTYTAILFYNDWLKHEEVAEIQKSYREQSFTVRNVRLMTECVPTTFDPTDRRFKVVRADAVLCAEENGGVASEVNRKESPSINSISIGAVKDSGLVYRLYNDTLCQGYQLPEYVHISSLSSFEVQELTGENFCRSWFMSK